MHLQANTITGLSVVADPTSINFGNQPVGSTSLPKKITLSNESGKAVSIAGIAITGPDASDCVETNNCGKSIAAGARCSVRVTFTPSVIGARSARVPISDNGDGSSRTVKLAGTGTGN